MELLGTRLERNIYYLKYDTSKNWSSELPNKNWLLILVVDKRSINIISEIARKCINRNVCYVCCIGKECEYAHDIFDEQISINEVENRYLPTHPIITTWDNDFEEGLWFATTSAFNDDEEIKMVICFDVTEADKKEVIQNILSKMNDK